MISDSNVWKNAKHIEHKSGMKRQVEIIFKTKTLIPKAPQRTFTNLPFPWPCFSQFPAQSAPYPSSALFAPLKCTVTFASDKK